MKSKKVDLKNEHRAANELFRMHAAYTQADADAQIRKAKIIDDILENSFLRHVVLKRL